MSSEAKDSLRKLGIITDKNICLRNHLLNTISILIPALGALFAILSLPLIGLTHMTLAVSLLFLILNSIGIELGLHRYFTHKAFKAGSPIRVILGVLGSWAFQGPIIRWVADHRRHHRFSDSPNDTHSPFWIRDAPAGKLRGLLWAHLIWMLKGDVSDPHRYAADLLLDPISVKLSRCYWVIAVAGLLIPALIGYALNGIDEFVRCFLWAGCVRVFLLHQFTWSINSIGHTIGTRVSGSKDQSRDNRILAVLTLGAGLHSYHHKHPATAINRPIKWDSIGILVIFLKSISVIWNVRRY